MQRFVTTDHFHHHFEKAKKTKEKENSTKNMFFHFSLYPFVLTGVVEVIHRNGQKSMATEMCAAKRKNKRKKHSLL